MKWIRVSLILTIRTIILQLDQLVQQTQNQGEPHKAYYMGYATLILVPVSDKPWYKCIMT